MVAAIKSHPALRAALTEVQRTLKAAEAKIGPARPQEPDYWPRHREAMTRCATALTEGLGARITTDWRGARVRIAGVTSSSTAGLAFALRNWVSAAQRKLAELDEAGARS